ncbi:histidine phosphatase family protein [Patescibacteria group bacterium]
MENKTLYFIRHAQSVYNEMGLIQGDLDPALSEKGRKDVKEHAPLYEVLELKHIAHSPLLRAKTTAETIGETLNIPTSTWPGLEEMDFGKWDCQMKFENWAQFRTDFYQHGMAPPGGESKRQVYERVENEVINICNETSDDPVMIVCHGMVMRILLGEWFTNSSEKELRAIEMPNLALYKVDVKYDSQQIRPQNYELIDIHEG